MEHAQTKPPASTVYLWGFWAMLVGLFGMIAVMVQIFGPSLDPTPSVGTQIGEIAGDMKRAAWRSLFGLEQPAPEPVSLTIRDWLPLVGPILGVIAIGLSAISLIREENRQLAIYGSSIGVAAITFQFIWWIALLIAGVVLLMTIIGNLGEFFSF